MSLGTLKITISPSYFVLDMVCLLLGTILYCLLQLWGLLWTLNPKFVSDGGGDIGIEMAFQDLDGAIILYKLVDRSEMPIL